MTSSGINRKFMRDFPTEHQNNLKNCALYPELLPLVRSGEIFPAIRERCMDFYYSGHRALRRTQNICRTNNYFLKGKPENGKKSRDISFDEKDASLSSILQRCREKATAEALLLAKTYPFFSFAVERENKDFPILIDIEARFAALDDGKVADKVDLVFLLPQSLEILFIEGKRRSDSRIRSKAGTPEVVGQVARYRDQLINREKEILKAYTESSNIMKHVFGCTFPEPVKVLKHVPILVVGDNKPGKDLLENNHANDKWLEDELKNAEKGSYGIWSKDGALLLDGRSIFLDPENRMGDLATGLNELADTIRKF